MRKWLLTGIGWLIPFLFAAAQTPAQRYVDLQRQGGPLKGAAWGVLAVDREGRTLCSHNAGERLTPASNLKLVTTGTALHAFGPDYRFPTELGYTGEIRDGVLVGDVYILGHGDPTIGSKDSIATDTGRLFWLWKSLLRKAGIQAIDGRIIGHGGAYEGNLEHPSWSYDDLGTYYGCGMSALCFYQNAIDFQVKAAAEGQPVQIQQTYPETPWMHVTNFGVTGPAGSGNSLYLYTTDLAPYAQMRGVFGVDRQPKKEGTANKYGALTCAYYFWKNLRETGWEVTGGYAHVSRAGYIQGPDFEEKDLAGTPVQIGFTESPRLADIARITNVRSDNFYAESMLRYMGEKATGIAEYDSCLVAESVVLKDLGLNLDQVCLVDGSGLSGNNLVTPEWMVNFLDAMRKSPAFPAFLASLPKPGEGTLSPIRFPGCDRVRMKSGSFTGTLCYSGYILDEAGKPAVTFSILTNSSLASTSQVRAVLMQMVRRLME